VRETIVTTALLRLDRSVSRADKLARAEAVIDEVDMRKCAHSRIGNDLVGGISGGARPGHVLRSVARLQQDAGAAQPCDAAAPLTRRAARRAAAAVHRRGGGASAAAAAP